MTKRKASTFHLLDEAEPAIGIVRCKPGDMIEWHRLADMLLWYIGEDPEEYPIADPVWYWYRCNPCVHGYHGWDLGYADGPGVGVWAGAHVVPQDEAEQMSKIENRGGHHPIILP